MTTRELLAFMSADLLSGDLAAKGARYLDDGIVDRAAVVSDAAHLLVAVDKHLKAVEDEKYLAQHKQRQKEMHAEPEPVRDIPVSSIGKQLKAEGL
jgi:hypothetical protein